MWSDARRQIVRDAVQRSQAVIGSNREVRECGVRREETRTMVRRWGRPPVGVGAVVVGVGAVVVGAAAAVMVRMVCGEAHG